MNSRIDHVVMGASNLFSGTKILENNKIKCIPIGLKRNLAVQYCKNSYILHMDDDDYYYPGSIRKRVELLTGLSNRYSQIRGVGCATFAAFEINKYISMINNKNFNLPFQKN